MAMKKKPVTGMKDILPKEMAIRDYCIGLIKETYKTFGFTSVETPCVEHIENLSSNQGGENEKLIFKILKRGDKLTGAVDKLIKTGTKSVPDADKAEASNIDNETGLDIDVSTLSDSGLRYDLTLPLSRYYSNICQVLLRHFRWEMFGELTDPREADTVNLCSAI